MSGPLDSKPTKLWNEDERNTLGKNIPVNNEKRPFALAFQYSNSNDKLLCRESQPMKKKLASVGHVPQINKQEKMRKGTAVLYEDLRMYEEERKAKLIEEQLGEKDKVIAETKQMLESECQARLRLLDENQRIMKFQIKEKDVQLLAIEKKEEEIRYLRAQLRLKDKDLKEVSDDLRSEREKRICLENAYQRVSDVMVENKSLQNLVAELKEEKEKIIAENNAKFFRSLIIEMQAKEKAIADSQKAHLVIKSLKEQLARIVKES